MGRDMGRDQVIDSSPRMLPESQMQLMCPRLDPHLDVQPCLGTRLNEIDIGFPRLLVSIFNGNLPAVYPIAHAQA